MGKIFIDYDSIRNEKLRDLEILSCDEMTKKVNELKGIVDSIEKNWQGSNANLYRKEIENIIDAITKFRKDCLEKNIVDITSQIEKYRNNEEIG